MRFTVFQISSLLAALISLIHEHGSFLTIDEATNDNDNTTMTSSWKSTPFVKFQVHLKILQNLILPLQVTLEASYQPAGGAVISFESSAAASAAANSASSIA